MKKICAGILLLTVLSACHSNTHSSSGNNIPADSLSPVREDSGKSSPVHETKIPADYLIIPGKSIGKTRLNEEAATLSTTLGKPDFSDAAMGKAWLVWFGKKRDEHNNRTELDVYITYKDSTMSSKAIKEIRTTSSAFKVNDSIHVYASLATIQKYFPGTKYVEKYQDDTREISIYDDVRRGIAFDIAAAGTQHICTGIAVHEPGRPVSDVYIRLHPEKSSP